jgi:hypothetical protein
MKPTVTYLEGEYAVMDRPMLHHLMGLSYTATGYGEAIPSRKMIIIQGETRPRRVFVTCRGNAGSAWIRFQGMRLYLRD